MQIILADISIYGQTAPGIPGDISKMPEEWLKGDWSIGVPHLIGWERDHGVKISYEYQVK